MLNRPQEVVARPPPRNSLHWLIPDIEKGITMKILPRKILMIQMIMLRPLIKALVTTPITACVQSSTAPAHRDDVKVSMPDEEEMNKIKKPSNGNLTTTTVAKMKLMMGKMISRI